MVPDDKITHAAAEGVGGQAKDSAGHVTGDESLEAEGKGDQASASVKKAGDNVADVAKDVFGH